MRARGITYDTGFINPTAGGSTHEPFDPERVRREMRVIRDDLHCTAVRVTGGDPDRLEIAAAHAADAGLEVWFCPFTCDLTRDELLDLLADCAARAERIRRQGADVVFVTGSELSLFTAGFLPGETFQERIDLFSTPRLLREQLGALPVRINEFLGQAVVRVHEQFAGKVTYASLPLEGVDWEPFDIVATDAGYRSIEIADQFREQIRTSVAAHKKPLAVTEFGCTTHKGAAEKGARSEIVEWGDDGWPVRLNGEYTRDEQEQATYLRELLDVFSDEGVDAAFVCTFASHHMPHRDDPREDLDMSSFGIVAVLQDRFGSTYPDMPWEPKAAFAALADYYGRASDDHQTSDASRA